MEVLRGSDRFVIPCTPHRWKGAERATNDAFAALNSGRLGWGEWTGGNPGARWWTGPIVNINRPAGAGGKLKVGDQLHGDQTPILAMPLY